MSTSDFNHIVAPPQMLSQLLVIKGILKEKFPTLKKGIVNCIHLVLKYFLNIKLSRFQVGNMEIEINWYFIKTFYNQFYFKLIE